MADFLEPFAIPASAPAIGPPAGWTVAQGAPEARTWRLYAGMDGKMIAGLWQCTPGAFQVAYKAWEFCQFLSGTCLLTPDGRTPRLLRAGDAFVVEPGFAGRWEVLETVTKHFVFRLDPLDPVPAPATPPTP